MKILFLIETLGNGGAERVLLNTLPSLQKLGVECEVAILFERDDLVEELEVHGIKVHRLNLSYKWNVIEGVFKLNRLIKTNNYDIIHAHLFFAYFFTGLVKLFHRKVKTIATFHNIAYDADPANTLVKKLRKKLDAFIVNRLINNKTAVSNAVKDHFEKHLNIPHVDLIFNSFPLDDINVPLDGECDDILTKYVDVNLYDTFSITPGRLVKEKGHIYLLEAIEQLDKNTIKLCHFIVGSGPLEEEVKRKIEKKGLFNVVLINVLPQKELFNLIRACDFVVVPSVSEGFGMAVGEAMALGKPVIASEINGIIDLFENKKEGLLVSPKDSKALSKAMKQLYNDRNMQKILAMNAKEKIKQFDTKMIAKQWKEYYRCM